MTTAIKAVKILDKSMNPEVENSLLRIKFLIHLRMTRGLLARVQFAWSIQAQFVIQRSRVLAWRGKFTSGLLYRHL